MNRILTDNVTYHPAVDLFPLMDVAGLEDLTRDIKENGQREPVRLDENGRVIDGRHRIMACEKLGRSVEAKTYSGNDDDIMRLVISLNLSRRHLNEAQRAAVAAKLANLKSGERKDYAEGRSIDLAVTQAEAAEKLNVSEPSVKRAQKVLRDGTPELKKKLEAGEVSVSAAADVAELPHDEQQEVVAGGAKEVKRAAKAVRAKKKAERAAKKQSEVKEMRSDLQPLPADAFDTIVVDPPWQRENPIDIGGEHRVMSKDEIRGMAVEDLASADCVLWLWTTNELMHEAYKAIEAWGFRPRTVLTWDKVTAGSGACLQEVTEHCIVATKGTPKFELTQQTTLIRERLNEDSRRPDAFFKLLDEICPGTKLEMFPRAARVEWESWGWKTDEVNGEEQSGQHTLDVGDEEEMKRAS